MNNFSKLSEFGFRVSEEWKALEKEELLNDILDSFRSTRISHTREIEIPNQFGIYAFFIKPEKVYQDCNTLIDVWNIESFRKYPKVVKKRFGECEAVDGWFPFYIGKSEKLGKRINEHLNHPSKHATYGLKLKERTAFLKDNQIEVGYWALPEMEGVPREIKQFIITNLESRLREKMKPWVGKQ